MPAFIPPLLGLIGLLIALGIFRVVLSYSEGSPEVKKIGDMIHSGAMSFMKTEYTYLVVFVKGDSLDILKITPSCVAPHHHCSSSAPQD